MFWLLMMNKSCERIKREFQGLLILDDHDCGSRDNLGRNKTPSD